MPFEAYRTDLCEAVAPAAYFGCRVVLHDPERSAMKMTDIVYRPGIDNWPRPSYLSVPNNIKQLGKT